MGKTLNDIANEIKSNDKKVQLIYAFNGVGKTRLSKEFKSLITPKADSEDEVVVEEILKRKILYYSAFTEDLFYWDNDLENDLEPKLKIHPNGFTKWVLETQGQDQNVISTFQYYTDDKLTPKFNQEYTIDDKQGNKKTVKAFSEVTFSFQRGNEEQEDNIKISKGEESNFIWCVFYTVFKQVIEELNEALKNNDDESDELTSEFEQLEYIYIDDPVTSLDDNHLIQLAVDLAELVKSSKSELKFIITTHNPLFFNVLYNEFNKNKDCFLLNKNEEGEFELKKQGNDSPFSYHIFLIKEIEKAITEGTLKKYHFNFLRNVLEKLATFLGYSHWRDLLPKQDDGLPNPYEKRIINLYSHSAHSAEEITELTQDDKNVMGYIMREIIKGKYNFQ